MRLNIKKDFVAMGVVKSKKIYIHMHNVLGIECTSD